MNPARSRHCDRATTPGSQELHLRELALASGTHDPEEGPTCRTSPQPGAESPQRPAASRSTTCSRTRCFIALIAMLLLYFVGAEEGATSVFPGMTLHEWVHDARHLLGFPCH